MRKLKLQVQISLDGFVADANGDMGWMSQDWDNEMMDYVGGITDPVDCILLGRKLATGFIPYWKSVADDPENPERDAGIKFTDTRKIVFSRSSNTVTGNHTEMASADLVKTVEILKSEKGGDLIAYGGANFVSSLIKENLIDEYHLFVSPVAIGKGMSIFAELEQHLNLKLSSARAFSCGIALLFYKRILTNSEA